MEKNFKQLNLKEKIFIKLIFLIIKVISPTEYQHDWKDLSNEILEDIRKSDENK